MSTLPNFQGGLEPLARFKLDGRIRESEDPDDYSCGFALWSGTSFSSPLLAGWLAAGLGTIDEKNDTRAAAVDRVWAALEKGTELSRPPEP